MTSQSIAAAEHRAPLANVAGKVAFITGGDSGIGLGIARALLDAGMKVVITFRTPDHRDKAVAQLEDARDRLHVIDLDVTDRRMMAAAAEATIRKFGKVHLLVNSAGVIPIVSLSNATYDDWDWCMRVNVGGIFNGIHTFLPYLKQHGEGAHIVSTASIDGLVIGRLTLGVHAAAKFAVVGMMEVLRTELASSNIGVSVFCPGGVSTNIASSQRNRPAEFGGGIGALDAAEAQIRKDFGSALREAMQAHPGSAPMMDPREAGSCVLNGIRNNDLYILSHAEFEQALRDRSEALLASIPRNPPPPELRSIVARLMHNPSYAAEARRRREERG